MASQKNGRSSDATFEVVAHDHAILERNSGFIAVYYPDSVHSLLMTLYARERKSTAVARQRIWRKSQFDNVRVQRHQ